MYFLFFSEQLYDNLRIQCPDFAERLHPIHGDVLEDGFGMREKDRALLEEKVEIVFHSAATVRFDEALR